MLFPSDNADAVDATDVGVTEFDAKCANTAQATVTTAAKYANTAQATITAAATDFAAVSGDVATTGAVQATPTKVAEVRVVAGVDDTILVTATTTAKDFVAACSVGDADNYGEKCDTAGASSTERDTE